MHIRKTAFVVPVLLLLFAAGCNRVSKPSEAQLAQALRQETSTKIAPEYLTEGKRRSKRIWRLVQTVYEARAFSPIWTGDEALDVKHVVAALCRADEEGLNPSNYNLGAIQKLYQPAYENSELDAEARARKMAQADIAVTYSLLTYQSHLVTGYARPEWKVWQDRPPIDQLTVKTAERGRLKEALADLLPKHAQYNKLKHALAHYRKIQAEGGWEPLDLRKSGPDHLTARLRQEGDLSTPADEVASPEEIAAALKHLQRRNGLAETGRLDETTIKRLNVPVQARIRQIEINMERWRWLPRDLGSRFILVNVPAFELEAVEDEHTVLEMPVVVGKEYKPTPLFSDKMTNVVLNPTWNVPDSIAKEEMLPIVQKDPNYLSRNEMEVIDVEDGASVDPTSVDWNDIDSATFPYRFRQKPGEENSLGRIKFLFPNDFDVYLHDTPAQSLFKRKKRDYSHGCVRVARPIDLAAWVLKDTGEWSSERLLQTISEGSEKAIKLADPLPVYILYWTAWVADDGGVAFREDLYDEDRRLMSVFPPQVARASAASELCHALLAD